MKQKSLANWLKVIIVGTVLCGGAVFFGLVPAYGKILVAENPEFAYCYQPWLIFIWLCSLPCFASLVFGWKIAVNIGADNSFSRENSSHLRVISILAATDSAFFFCGNIALLLLNMSHPGIVIYSLIVVFAGVAVSVVCAALSHLVYKAALLREDSDLTI